MGTFSSGAYITVALRAYSSGDLKMKHPLDDLKRKLKSVNQPRRVLIKKFIGVIYLTVRLFLKQ